MNPKNFHPEFIFKSSRSGGKGGQNVNKVETKIELYFDITNSLLLSSDEKKKLLNRLKNRINKNGVLKIKSQTERTQFLNKQKVIKNFHALVENALQEEKVRKKTNLSETSKQERLSGKKNLSRKKELRKILNRDFGDD